MPLILSLNVSFPLRDAIPPIHNPVYDPAAEATWLQEDDILVGFSSEGGAWAYPVRILNFHEIVNDVLDGEPVLISYCPLCYSGIVYSRRLGDQVLTFGNTSALYESDLVMLDYDTGSYWWQVAGRAIVGPLTDETLTVLPSMMVTWSEWRTLHPEGLVLSRDTGSGRDYASDPFTDIADHLNNDRFAFPVTDAVRDERLDPAAKVLAVRIGDRVRAFPLELEYPAVITDFGGGQAVVVFIDPEGPSAAVYEPRVAGEALSFTYQDGDYVDQNTGSTWTLSGRATSGSLAGSQLEPVPSKTTFWFAIVAAEPGISVYQPEGEG